eukprot:15416768-Heterocapsa_arctica.AAC.1
MFGAVHRPLLRLVPAGCGLGALRSLLHRHCSRALLVAPQGRVVRCCDTSVFLLTCPRWVPACHSARSRLC